MAIKAKSKSRNLKTARQRWAKRTLSKSKAKEHEKHYTKVKNRKIEQTITSQICNNDKIQHDVVKNNSSKSYRLPTFADLLSPLANLLFGISKVLPLPKLSLSTSNSRKRKYEELEQRVSFLEKEVQDLKQIKLGRESNQSYSLQESFLLPTVLPPPPPPPPPPPAFLPPPTFKVSNSIKKIETKQKVNTKPTNNIITDELLKTIKLRKVSKSLTSIKESYKEHIDERLPVVSLTDIRSVQLKRTKLLNSKNVFNLSPSSLLKPKNQNLKKYSAGKKTPENIFLKQLRKSNIKRSPGGTPMIKKDFTISLGEGLTPMLSNALKKKFNQAHPDSHGTPEEINHSNTSTPNATLQFRLSPEVTTK